MGKEESPQVVTRRTTRSSSSSTPNSKNLETTKSCNPQPMTINDLVFGDEHISFDDLISSLPGRRSQIHELVRLLGPLNSPTIPLFIYGGTSTGKTSVVLQIFRYLNRPFVYTSCRTCYNPRVLFESILNQLSLHRKDVGNGYSSAKRCERPSDFVNLLREALLTVVNNLKGHLENSSSKKSIGRISGKMVYLIIDNLELVREWDKSANLLPFLFKLYAILMLPEVGLVYISNTSPDTYYSDTGYIEPIPVYFPDYTEEDLRQIFLRNQANQKLYSSFLEVVLRPFCRTTRRVDELSAAFSPLFKKYCEPLSDLGISPSEEMKRRLFSHLQPHIMPSLNEVFKISSRPSSEGESNKEKANRQGCTQRLRGCPAIDEIDFHMSTSAKYLLISAFLASRNPATLDASLFDSTGGSDNRKRKRNSSVKSMEHKEAAEQELLMKGPGTFPLERLLAIFQCITSVEEYTLEEEEPGTNSLGVESGDSGLMSDVLLQVSSLCNANFISKGGSCPLDGSTRYRSTASEDMALKVARSLKFPLSKYLYRR
ncbi:Origin of replication complex subunit like [Actinidia chinensis var. chinensis]|uniref:Origin of replication complex subunit like n=1 Tax=Actinidia chinensis var. chinensis TaxID=1590841 RepID=A0A2R6R9Q2_ACTCC|nr:Origin of replication complex subunit like [Actinidia chinensis var. chinensis]